MNNFEKNQLFYLKKQYHYHYMKISVKNLSFIFKLSISNSLNKDKNDKSIDEFYLIE